MFNRIRVSVVWFIAFVAALISWIQLIYKLANFSDKNNLSLSQVIAELTNPNSKVFDEGPIVSWLLFCVFFVLAISTILTLLHLIRRFFAYLDKSEVPISILETTIDVTIDEKDHSRSTTVRDQILHANKKFTSAFYSEHQLDAPSGLIDREKIEIISKVHHDKITDDNGIKVRGKERNIEIIELFNKPLPKNWIATYLPNDLVLYLFNKFDLFKGTIVKRHTSMEYINEYNKNECVLQLTSVRYPVTNVLIQINFPVELFGKISNIESYVLRNNAATKITICEGRHDSTTKPGYRSIHVRTRHLDQAKFRVTWVCK